MKGPAIKISDFATSGLKDDTPGRQISHGYIFYNASVSGASGNISQMPSG
jgi:hypothetical protein